MDRIGPYTCLRSRPGSSSLGAGNSEHGGEHDLLHPEIALRVISIHSSSAWKRSALPLRGIVSAGMPRLIGMLERSKRTRKQAGFHSPRRPPSQSERCPAFRPFARLADHRSA